MPSWWREARRTPGAEPPSSPRRVETFWMSTVSSTLDLLTPRPLILTTAWTLTSRYEYVSSMSVFFSLPTFNYEAMFTYSLHFPTHFHVILNAYSSSSLVTWLHRITQAPKKANAPSKNITTIPLKKCAKTSSKVVKSQGCNNFYRADLTAAATGRYAKLHRDSQVKKGLVKGARGKFGRNSRA